MQYITQHQIDLARTEFRKDSSIDTVAEVMLISMMVVESIVGEKWLEENIIDNLSQTGAEERMDYLRLPLGQGSYEFQTRFVWLANSLFLLQSCQGFNLKIDDLREVSPTKPKVKLEDIATELQILSLLVSSGHEIKFKPRTGIKGKDFDTEMIFKGMRLLVEIKCKREETAVNVNSLRRTLYEAEKQLQLRILLSTNTNKPSVIFVRIPEDWVKYENLAPEVNRVLRNFYRNVAHVKAVVFVWEEYIELSDKRMVGILKYKLNLHPISGNLYNLGELIAPQGFKMPFTSRGNSIGLSFGTFRD